MRAPTRFLVAALPILARREGTPLALAGTLPLIPIVAAGRLPSRSPPGSPQARLVAQAIAYWSFDFEV
jgi:hypothetical protein